MSFTLQLWQKPDEWPWPANYKEADAQIGRLFAGPKLGQNPRFLAFGRGLYERFPPETDVWLDGSEVGETDEAVLVFGITTRHDDFSAAYEWAVEVARRLGLNLTDPQSGDTFLANGGHVDDKGPVSPPSPPVPVASWEGTGWEALRAAAAGRQPGALFELGRRLRYGIGQRRHLWLSCALLRLGAHDEKTRAVADERWQTFGEADRPRLQALHDRLAAATGRNLLDVVDAERKAVDDAFAQAEREVLDSRTWQTGLERNRDAASAGHEVAAYLVALHCLITVKPADWEGFDRWSRVAAEWEHPPAMQLRHHVLARGIAQPDGRPDVGKAAWWRQQMKVPPRDWPGEGDALAQVVAWYAQEGVPMALFRRGNQLDSGQAGLPRDGLRAFDCFTRAAEAGHADATYNAAVTLEDGGAPRPLVTAMYMIAHSRGSQARAQGLAAGASDKDAVRAAMRDLLRPGRLRATIHAHVPLPSLASAEPAPPVQKARPQPAASAPRPRRGELDEVRADGGPGAGDGGSRLWLVLGLLVAPALLTMARPGPGFQVAVFIGGMLSAWGVWRFTAGGEWSVPMRCVLAGAAALPVGSLLISGLLLARGRRA